MGHQRDIDVVEVRCKFQCRLVAHRDLVQADITRPAQCRLHCATLGDAIDYRDGDIGQVANHVWGFYA